MPLCNSWQREDGWVSGPHNTLGYVASMVSGCTCMYVCRLHCPTHHHQLHPPLSALPTFSPLTNPVSPSLALHSEPSPPVQGRVGGRGPWHTAPDNRRSVPQSEELQYSQAGLVLRSNKVVEYNTASGRQANRPHALRQNHKLATVLQLCETS